MKNVKVSNVQAFHGYQLLEERVKWLSGRVVLSGHPHGAHCVMSALIGDFGMVLADLDSVCGKFFGIICKSFNVDSDK